MHYNYIMLNNELLVMLLLLFVIFVLLILLIIQQFRFNSKLKKERADAVKRSRAVLNGQMIEQLAPYLPNFPCNASDARFIGKPIDFIAFPGAVNNEKIKEVLLIEVKTGESQLSERDKEIKNAVKNGRVRYVEYRI